MADRSEHAKADRGQSSHPAYERLHPEGVDGGSGRGAPEEPVPAHEPGAREALFAHLFQVSSDGVVLHELLPSPKLGRFLDVNERMCQMLGYTREEILKLTLLDILGAEAWGAIPETVRRLRQSGKLVLETVLIRRDGQTVPVEVSVDLVEFRERRMTLSVISDEGQGFDLRSLGVTAGFGLPNVRERAEFLGGHMRIKSALGKGSTLSIAVPDALASAD